MSKSRKNRAATDDESGRSDELAGNSVPAKASLRVACAEVAAMVQVPGPGAPRNTLDKELLPKDGLGFAEAVHRLIDLAGVTQVLLRSKDEKIRQKMLEQVLDLSYGRNGRAVEPVKEKEEVQLSEFRFPTAKRD